MAAFRSRVELWAQAAGLLATACVVWSTSIAPYWGHPHLADRIFLGIWIAFGALAWAAVVGFTLLLVIWRLHRTEAPPIVRLSAMVWFAPATILLLQFSPIGLVSGLALIVNATRLLWEPSVGLLSLPFAPSWTVSAGFQLAGVAFLAGRPLPAACLLALSTAILTSVATAVTGSPADRRPSLPRSIFGLGLTVLLALMLGVITGGGSGGDAMETQTAVSQAAPAARQNTDQAESVPTGVDAAGEFPGVILWPEIKPVTTLIAPMLTRGSGPGPARPLTIPFGGEYWMFRWPLRRPPRTSYFQRGTPSALFFATTDRMPLNMEAHQKLAQAMSVRCCRLMRVEILNADRYPGTVSLELVLIDRDSPRVAPESLGTEPVTSVPDLKEDRPTPVAETLDFPFPPSPGLEQFDEIKMIFHRATNRVSKSARVSLERFVLVP